MQSFCVTPSLSVKPPRADVDTQVVNAVRSLKPRHPDSVQRHQNRLEIRLSDGIKAHVILSPTERLDVEVFDLNSFGASLVHKDGDAPGFDRGAEISLHIRFPDGVELSYAARVCWVAPHGAGRRIGVEFAGQVGVAQPDRDESEAARFPLPDYCAITGFFYKPYMFLERGHLRVSYVSSTRLGLVFYDSEVILFRGQKLRIWLLGPTKANEGIEVEVRNVERGEGRMVLVDAVIADAPRHFHEWIAHQLVFICDQSPADVRRYGFVVSRVSNGFRFRFVKTQEEYEAVLRLRYQAYLEAGKIDVSKTPADMAAPLDPKSRILVCYHGDRVVASVAISFPSDDHELLDTERAFAGGYPKPMPPKTQMVEISRLCTDSDYRKTDLLTRMFEYTYKVTVCGDRDYITTSTDAKLWPLYKKLGFRKTGMSYAHPYLSGLEHHVIIGKRAQPDFGTQISPLAWNYLWRDMNQFMDQRGLLEMTFGRRLRQRLLVFLGRLLKIQTDRMY